MTRIMNITSSGDSPLALTQFASSAGICDSASVVFSMSAPSRIRKIIAVACAVPSALSTRPFPRMPPLMIAIAPQAAAPMAAASVGFAQPP